MCITWHQPMTSDEDVLVVVVVVPVVAATNWATCRSSAPILVAHKRSRKKIASTDESSCNATAK